MSTETLDQTPAQLALALGLNIPDKRDDCDSRLASLLRDIYYFSERGLKTSKNKDWAKRYGLGERTIPHLLKLLVELGLIDIEIRHNRDRYITPRYTADDVALKWRRFAGYAWHLLSATCRAIITARKIKKATPVQKTEPPKAKKVTPEVAPSVQANLHPPQLERTERKQVDNNIAQVVEVEAPKLTHAESAAVTALIAQGVDPHAAEQWTRRFGAAACSTIARLLAYNAKRAFVYQNSITAWACWFLVRWVARKIELPAGFVNEPAAKMHASDRGEKPQRVVASPVPQEAPQLAPIVVKAAKPVQKGQEEGWNALSDGEQLPWLEAALAEKLQEFAPESFGWKRLKNSGINTHEVRLRAMANWWEHFQAIKTGEG